MRRTPLHFKYTDQHNQLPHEHAEKHFLQEIGLQLSVLNENLDVIGGTLTKMVRLSERHEELLGLMFHVLSGSKVARARYSRIGDKKAARDNRVDKFSHVAIPPVMFRQWMKVTGDGWYDMPACLLRLLVFEFRVTPGGYEDALQEWWKREYPDETPLVLKPGKKKVR